MWFGPECYLSVIKSCNLVKKAPLLLFRLMITLKIAWMRHLFTVLPPSTSSLTVKMNFTNILFSVSLIHLIYFPQILHPRGFSLFWALKRMRSMQHMTSSQNLMKSVLKMAKMQSGRKLLGIHMSCNIIFSAKI